MGDRLLDSLQKLSGTEGGKELVPVVVENMVDEYVRDSLSDCVEFGLWLCQSPIERLFLAKLLSESPYHVNFVFIEGAQPYSIGTSHMVFNSPMHSEPKLSIFPQKQIGDYRVDFFLQCTLTGVPDFEHKVTTSHGELIPGIKDVQNVLIVECDGHDFHEKTKEQAQKDKKRDRVLQAAGYHIYRFTGSEIWKNPTKCTSDVWEYLLKW